MKFLATSSEPPALSKWFERLIPKFRNRDYRHTYMVEGVKTWIARQVRTLREERNWSQADLAREGGKKQSAISRIEDPDYGQLSLQTLFDLAKAYDVALLVQFVEWPDWLNRMEDASTNALKKRSFDANELSSFAAWQFSVPQPTLLPSVEYRNTISHASILTTKQIPTFLGAFKDSIEIDLDSYFDLDQHRTNSI
jgi:transcriptional regulator with XRE-family HTH domain